MQLYEIKRETLETFSTSLKKNAINQKLFQSIKHNQPMSLGIRTTDDLLPNFNSRADIHKFKFKYIT